MAEVTCTPADPDAQRYAQYRQLIAELTSGATRTACAVPDPAGAARALAAVRRDRLLRQLEAERFEWTAVWAWTPDPGARANLYAHQPKISEIDGAHLACTTCTAGPHDASMPARWPCPPYTAAAQTARGGSGA